LQIFPASGHFLHEDQPDKTADVVVEFVKRNDRSTLVLPPKFTATPKRPTMSLPEYKQKFLKDCVSADALKFGTFTLKSKRVSPYFFNAGLFNSAELARSIASAYAHTLDARGKSDASFQWDVLFGPAYKGIPLASTTVTELDHLDNQRYGKKTFYSFNRKEAKDHGEGGSIVGASLKGKKIVIIDDVITAGTAIREAIDIIKREGGELVGIIVAFDRQEKTPTPTDDDGKPGPSAIGEVRKKYGIPVLAILTLDDVVKYLRGLGSEDDLKRLDEYRAKYKAGD
jgi:orotate phosphoribosyltransferase